ncbi:SMR family transporter [Sphingomonas sp. PB4P5]
MVAEVCATSFLKASAYAIWSGVGVILIAAVAWIFHGQKLDAAAIAGMTLIVAGVIVMNTMSKVTGH